ncbi:hypothetical protein [Mariniplasma anaerobium]|nr:hypothetical protein [Mariniplasma anaerobium]
MKEKYINEVLSFLEADRKTKKRVKEDLNEIIEFKTDDTYETLLKRHGDPESMAKDFMENLDIPDQYYGITIGLSRRKRSFEYKSKRKIMGIPLLHVNIGGRYKNKVAKGIIAIGDISFGVISIGGISAGLISLGGISAGLLAIGGVSAGLLSIGVISVGVLAIGIISKGVYYALHLFSSLNI